MMHATPARVPQTWLTSLDATLGLFALSQAPADPMPTALAWARFLAPLAVAAAVVNTMLLVLSNMSHRVRARTRRRHLVIVGCGPTALTIALDAQEKSLKSVAIDLTEAKDYAQEIREIGIPVVTVVRDGEAKVEATLFRMALRGANIKSASDILVVTGSDDTNARASKVISQVLFSDHDHAMENLNWRGVKRSSGSGRSSPRIFVESTSLELTYWLQDMLPQLGDNPVEWFSSKERGARDLLDQMAKATPSIMPGTNEDGIAPSLLIVGTNPTAAAAAVQFCRNWSSGQQTIGDPGSTPEELPVLTVADDPYDPTKSDLPFMIRALGDWTGGSPGHAKPRCVLKLEKDLRAMKVDRVPDVVVVALESDVHSMGAARMVRQIFKDSPIWVCCEDSIDMSTLARPPFEKNMTVVSLSRLGLTIDRIRSGIGEDLARAIQSADYAYRHKALSGSSIDDPANRVWDDLDEDTKEKNRAAVDGWRTALAKLHFVVAKVTPPGHSSPLDWLEQDFVAEYLHEAWKLVMDERGLWTTGTRAGFRGEESGASDPNRTTWALLPEEQRHWSKEQAGELCERLACFDYFIESSDWRRTYIESVGRSYFDLVGPGSNTNPLVSWDDADEVSREANKASARASLVYLARLRMHILPQRESRNLGEPCRITEAEVARLAPQEHQRWMENLRSEGWTNGAEKSESRRTHPYLVNWSDLAPDIRAKDEVRIRRIPEVLRNAGYEISRL
jgi:hypothetical protein